MYVMRIRSCLAPLKNLIHVNDADWNKELEYFKIKLIIETYGYRRRIAPSTRRSMKGRKHLG